MSPDRYRRRRVRTMRKILRQHGSPVPKHGCLGALLLSLIQWKDPT